MSVTSIVNRGRIAHLRLMRDQCDIVELGEKTFDPATGQYTQGETVVYSGMCRLKPTDGNTAVGAGERQVALRRYLLELPWETSQFVKVDHVASLTTSDDPWAVGRRLVVLSVAYGTDRVARRLEVEDRHGGSVV